MRDARARWLDEAVELGVTPAGDGSRAVAKVALLTRSTGSRLIDVAIHDGREDDLCGVLAVITCAATAEAERWGLPKPRFDTPLAARDDVGRAGILGRPGDRDLEHYRRAREQWTFEWAERRIATLDRHVRALRDAGRVELVEGAHSELRLAVLKALALPAHSLVQLEAKHVILAQHAELVEPAWLVDPIVGATLLREYRSLDMSAADERRLRAMLPRSEGHARPPEPAISIMSRQLELAPRDEDRMWQELTLDPSHGPDEGGLRPRSDDATDVVEAIDRRSPR